MKLRPILPLLALALAACQSHPLTTSDDLALDVAKPIAVERVRVQYDARFAPGAADLPYDEALRLETFLDQAGVRPNDRVFVASPEGDPLAAARAGRIATLLAERSAGMVPIAPPPSGVARDHLLVLVDRFVAQPPACPNWSGSPETGHENVPGSNFGCADATDLAAMVANPRDLMMGHTLGPADAEPTLDAYSRYRTGQVKPLLSAGQQGGSPQGGSSSSSSSASGAASPAAGMSGASPAPAAQ